MTQDEIIRMALEAGDWNGQTAEFNDVGLERFAALVAASRDAWWIEQMQGEEDQVRADEREACAKVCDEVDQRDDIHPDHVAIECAAAIRARS